MVASLFAYNFDERVRDVLSKVRNSFAKDPNLPSQIIAIGHQGTGFAVAPGESFLCGMLREAVREGHTIVGIVSNGRRKADDCRSIRVHMASKTDNVMYEADVITPNGYPLLAEFVLKEHPADFRQFFKGDK
jgi:hypothetical protein